MSGRFGPSIIFASDKVIFDAMNHSQVSVDLIRQLFFERGVLVSHKTERLELAAHFSRLTADYFDHKSIARKLGKISRRERVTSVEIDGPLSPEEIKAGVNPIVQKLRERGDTVSVSMEDGGLQIRIEYDHIDYSESEFRQVQPKSALIQILPDNKGGCVVRSTHNKYIDGVTSSAVSSIERGVGRPLAISSIGLEGHTDAQLRIGFFEELIDGIDGYYHDSVTDAYCYKPRSSGVALEDEERSDDIERQPYVLRVTLKGDAVNKTFMADDLYRNGYYLVKVVWRVKAKLRDSELVELEAQFGDPTTCTGFSYQARSVITCEDGVATDQRRPATSEEQDRYAQLIESAARRAMAKLRVR